MKPGPGQSERWPPLVVEFEAAPSSGLFRVDERLRVEEVSLRSDDVESSARVAVRLDDSFDAVAARSRYLPDCRIMIRTNEPAPIDRTMLFEGYPPLMEAEWDGRPGKAKDRCMFTAEHVYGRLARDEQSWIYGRRMRNAAIEDGLTADPSLWRAASRLITALPCIFNFDGVGNCAANPLAVKGPNGDSRSVYLFTYDEDVTAKKWTYLNALRYLCWFYRLREGPVGEGNIFSDTDAYADFDPGGHTVVVGDSELIRRLMATPESLTVEATNLVEALALVTGECGIHVTAETVNEDGRSVSRMRIWADQDNAAKHLSLGWGGRYPDGTRRFEASNMSAAEVYAANIIERATIAWDHRQVVNTPIVVGGVKHYEMTLPLVPGWEPEADLDSVDVADRPTAKTLAWTPDQIDAYGDGVEEFDWYRRYHKEGEDFAQYRNISRLWVLNEDGRFDDATYHRNAPFDHYEPFDFSTVAGPEVTTMGAWTRRVRELKNSITVGEDGESFGVYVQVSFDSGSTWSKPAGPVRVRFDPTGIHFDVINPTSITPPDTAPEVQNMWYAIIDQTFRVRVTALMESDARLIVRHGWEDAETPTLWTTSRVIYRPGKYRFESRSDTTDALADVNPAATDIGDDDTAAAALLAERIAIHERDGRVVVAPTVPWLETGIRVGDRLSGVAGRGLSFGSRTSRRSNGPCVVGKRFWVSDDRLETDLLLGFTELAT